MASKSWYAEKLSLSLGSYLVWSCGFWCFCITFFVLCPIFESTWMAHNVSVHFCVPKYCNVHIINEETSKLYINTTTCGLTNEQTNHLIGFWICIGLYGVMSASYSCHLDILRWIVSWVVCWLVGLLVYCGLLYKTLLFCCVFIYLLFRFAFYLN